MFIEKSSMWQMLIWSSNSNYEKSCRYMSRKYCNNNIYFLL